MTETKGSREPVWENLRSRPGWRSIEDVWRSPYFSYAIAAIFFFAWLYLQWHLPPSSWAITLLTIAAAFMALRGEMPGREKWLWFLVVLLYGGLTIRADSKDRRKADKELTDNFTAISLTAKDNLHASLTDSGQKFGVLLENQNHQFQTMLNNQRLDFSQTLGRLNKQERKLDEQIVTLMAVQSIEHQVWLDSEETRLELGALIQKPPGQTSSPPVGIPPQNSVPAPEPEAIKELKIKALQLAIDIYDWIALVSKDAPNLSGPMPHNSEETKILNAYLDRLNTEWQNKFSTPANNMVSALHITGLLLSCRSNPGERNPSQILRLHTNCADHIRSAALDLK